MNHRDPKAVCQFTDTMGQITSKQDTEAEGPITKRQIFLVQNSWTYLASDTKAHGLVFFERYAEGQKSILAVDMANILY